VKITANREQLLSMVKTVYKAVPASSTLEILKGILVEADSDHNTVTCTGTNYEVAIQCRINTYVELPGSMVIDAKLFCSLLSLFGCDDVTMTLNPDGSVCTLTSGAAYYQLAVLPAKNYPKPDIPFPEGAVKVTNLPALAKNSVFAADKTGSKPVMAGVRLDIYSDCIRACGCDGNRLMERRLNVDTGGRLKVVIPARAFSLLAGLTNNKDALEVGVAGSNAVFMKEGFLFSVRTILGEYIDVDHLMESVKPEYAAVIDAKELHRSLNSINVIPDGSRVNLVFEDNTLKATLSSPAGRTQTTVPAEIKTATLDNGFYYNTGHLLEALRRLSGKVTLQLSSIGMLTVQTDSDLYLQLPVQAPKIETKPKAKKTPKKQKEAA
jgi:DNA polymerase-3 subunit beta